VIYNILTQYNGCTDNTDEAGIGLQVYEECWVIGNELKNKAKLKMVSAWEHILS
jgi:hypothetical protein